jgi:molybdopterin-binding protein
MDCQVFKKLLELWFTIKIINTISGKGGNTMKYGARNKIGAKVKAVKSGEIMSLVKFDVTTPCEMASVLTTESLNELDLKPGDNVELVIKAIHVLPIKK